jgi:hypothetical protein
MQEILKSRKHCSCGHLAGIVQNVRKIVENAKCGNMKSGFYCTLLSLLETDREDFKGFLSVALGYLCVTLHDVTLQNTAVITTDMLAISEMCNFIY